ncbi:MAG: outer membrane protein assembly factor BamE, partial [Holophagales bacterium]|nr:outer membrane protein assembly factor BamE [Holophagales bacterium]
IGIYDQALSSDPENELLLAAKAEAEALRHMTEERFSQVEKGMSQEEVRELLGTVKSTNVRDFTERNRIGWFYRKEDGGAAGVYFKPGKAEGEWTVESLDFDAVESPTANQDS